MSRMSHTRQVLEENADLLERVAAALLERETLDVKAIALLNEGRELPPLPVEEQTPPPPEPTSAESLETRESPLEGAGGEPAPAPA